jgi:hypothetical protein
MTRIALRIFNFYSINTQAADRKYSPSSGRALHLRLGKTATAI